MAASGTGQCLRHSALRAKAAIAGNVVIAARAGFSVCHGGPDPAWRLIVSRGSQSFKRRAWANIPPRSNRNEPICFSPYLYRARNLVERFFNKIKQCRRIATRYGKLAANYLAFIQLASIRLWLRVNEYTP